MSGKPQQASRHVTHIGEAQCGNPYGWSLRIELSFDVATSGHIFLEIGVRILKRDAHIHV